MRTIRELTRSGKKRISRSWGEWLSPMPWALFGTFTFAEERRSTEAAKKAFTDFVTFYGDSIRYFAFIEWHACRTSVHIHVLLLGVGKLIRWEMMEAWQKRYGYARIFLYEKERGAEYYVTKHVADERCDWFTNIDGEMGQPKLESVEL